MLVNGARLDSFSSKSVDELVDYLSALIWRYILLSKIVIWEVTKMAGREKTRKRDRASLSESLALRLSSTTGSKHSTDGKGLATKLSSKHYDM